MWEALMMLRLIASLSSSLPLGRARSTASPALPTDSSRGAIRLSFAAWRLSLPLSEQRNSHGNHDRRIA